MEDIAHDLQATRNKAPLVLRYKGKTKIVYILADPSRRRIKGFLEPFFKGLLILVHHLGLRRRRPTVRRGSRGVCVCMMGGTFPLSAADKQLKPLVLLGVTLECYFGVIHTLFFQHRAMISSLFH